MFHLDHLDTISLFSPSTGVRFSSVSPRPPRHCVNKQSIDTGPGLPVFHLDHLDTVRVSIISPPLGPRFASASVSSRPPRHCVNNQSIDGGLGLPVFHLDHLRHCINNQSIDRGLGLPVFHPDHLDTVSIISPSTGA